MNGAEQAYSASEAEMLALVWATKFFCCYIYGRNFVVRTDHSALTGLRNFSDQNGRLISWSLKLAELDIVVERRPGSKVRHLDALTNHIGAVVYEGG
jgi:hypothetical protein